MINCELKKTIKNFLKCLCALCVLHAPSVLASENLFECRTAVIEGSDAAAFFVIDDSAKASLDWFDQENTKIMSCRISISGAKYSARAHTNDITFEFEKDACVSLLKNSDSRLEVMNEGFLKISDRTTGGYVSHLLMFYRAQPQACEIEKIDRNKLEQLATKISQDKEKYE